jgi:hypothetical protein
MISIFKTQEVQMQAKVWCLCIVLLMVAANFSLSDEAPLYRRDNVLAGFNFNDGSGSSDMTLIMRLMGDDEIYVDEGDDVKYVHDPDNQEIGDEWIEADFDDSDWEDGISGVGFADGDDNTTVTSGRISIWTRYYFDASNADKVKALILYADYDDQYIAWLNGVKIAASAGAPAGDPPAWNASQGGVTNRGSLEMAAGQPNEARWNQGAIEETEIEFEFAGNSPIAVEATGKLAVTWGDLKR